MPNKLKFPQVYFRVDRGEFIGDGHLFRDKALAARMVKVGFDPIFVTRPNEESNDSFFSPYKVLTLSKKQKKTGVSYSEWLGVSEKQDVEECLDVIGRSKGNIWIVDHYGINEEWEREIIRSGQFLVAIDDLFRSHYCHIVLDHNLTADLNKYVNGYPCAKYLMGPQYALLRDDICKAQTYNLESEKKSSLLFLGSVEESLFYKILNQLRKMKLGKLQILNPPIGFQVHENEEVISFCNDLPALYEKQKVVFGSCGVAHLERIVLGVPSVTCVIVDNQIEVGKKTEELDFSFHLGDLRLISEEALYSKIAKALSSTVVLKEKAKKGKGIISKKGTEFVVQAIEDQFAKWQKIKK